MILIFGAENEPNIPLLIDILNHRKKSWCRINGEDFPKKIKVDFEIGKSSNVTFVNSFKRKDIIDLSTVKAVWNRRRGNIDPPHELKHGHRLFIKDEIVAVKDGFLSLTEKARWMNKRWSDTTSNNALVQFKAATDLNLRIPKTLITQNTESAKRFIDSNKTGTIIKQLGKNALLGYEISPLYTSRIDTEHYKYLQTIENCPNLLQERILCEVELRITVVGQKVFCAATEPNAHSAEKPDIRQDKGLDIVSFYPWKLQAHVENQILRLMKNLDLVFACIDMMVTKNGDHVFIELNNSGQWGWIEDQAGLPITEAIANWLTGDK